MLLYGFLFSDYKYSAISYGAILSFVPWIICIVDSVKSKKNANGLWVILIIAFGTIFIPLWLIYHGKDRISGIQPLKIENNE